MRQTSITCDPRTAGTVKWYNAQKGIGFILADSVDLPSGVDPGGVFVHHTNIVHDGPGRPDLETGQRVTFILVSGPKGLFAADVAIASERAATSRGDTAQVHHG